MTATDYRTAQSGDDRSEKARRAVENFRRMQPMLNNYARVFTGNPRISVEVSAMNNGATDGKKIWFRPPIALGENHKHNKKLCDRRDRETHLQLCEACAIREEVLVTIYHEIAHICYGTFAQPSSKDKAELIASAVEEAGGKYAQYIAERIRRTPGYITENYMGMAGTVSPFLHTILNALEDARVNNNLFLARRGTKVMFDADTRRVFERGVESPNPDGTVTYLPWNEREQNLQAIIGVFCVASGYDISGWFISEVERALEDQELNELILDSVNAPDVRENYKIAFKVLKRLRELGFCKRPDEPEPEDQPTKPGEPGDETGEGEGGEPEDNADQSGEESGNEEGSGSASGDSGDSGEETEEDERDDSSVSGGSGDTDESSDDADEPADSGDDSESDSPEAEADDTGDGEDETGSDESAPVAGNSDGSPDDDSGADDEGLGDDSDPQDSDELHESGESDEAPSQHGEPGVSADVLPDDGDDSGDAAEGEEEDEEEVTSPTTDEWLDEGEETERESGDPDDQMDTGADKGEGGIEVKEDKPSDLPMGEPEDVQAGLETFGGHEHKPLTAEQQLDEEAVKQAVMQGLYFETPSANVLGVREHHFGKPIINDIGQNMSTAWGAKLYENQMSRHELGIDGDFKPTEAIMGRALLKLRTVLADNQRAHNINHLKSGRVNTRVLGRRAPLGDERLFRKKITPGKRDYFVVLGLDISGSTAGRNLEMIKAAAWAQADLLTRMGIQFAMYGYSGYHGEIRGYYSGLYLDMYVLKEPNEPWNTKTQERLLEIGPDGGNLDGHNLEYMRKVCDKSNATDKIIMYFSDGKMPATNFEEELEILVRELAICKKKGYTVAGVGIRTDSPSKHGLPTVRIDSKDEVIKVVAHLEKLLRGH
jgi:hypothetical protein